MEDLVLSCLESRVEENRNLYARFLVGPFLKGNALTVATALRRVLLSSVESIGITALYIQGITHEFSTIPGVRESVLEISLNFGAIVLSYDKTFFQKKSFFDKLQIGYLQVQGPKVIYANHLKLPLGVKLVDPTQYIATVSKEGSLVIKFIIGKKNDLLHQSTASESHFGDHNRDISSIGEVGKKNIAKAKKTAFYKNGSTIACVPTNFSVCVPFVPFRGTRTALSPKKQVLQTLAKKPFCKAESYKYVHVLASPKGTQTQPLWEKLCFFKATAFRKCLLGQRARKKIARAQRFVPRQEGFYAYNSSFCKQNGNGKNNIFQGTYEYKTVKARTNNLCDRRAQHKCNFYVTNQENNFRRKTCRPNDFSNGFQAKTTSSKISKDVALSFNPKRVILPSVLQPERGTQPKVLQHLRWNKPFGFQGTYKKGTLYWDRHKLARQTAHTNRRFVKAVRLTSPKTLFCNATIFPSVYQTLFYKPKRSSQLPLRTPKQRNMFCNATPFRDKREKENSAKVKRLKFLNNTSLFSSSICLRNVIPLDSTSTPILKVSFVVEIDDEVLYLRQRLRERIILEVWTNGSIHPRQAVHDAALSLTDMFASFRSLYQIETYPLSRLKVQRSNKSIKRNFQYLRDTSKLRSRASNTIGVSFKD